ncbi:MAG TPA: hypothetical protein DCZ62_03265 [Ruminococcus sp.]|nr:hypothetical protein [Ruminococcus sp.]
MRSHLILDKLIQKSSAKAVDICSRLNIKKAYLSRIRSGTLLPPSFDILDDIAKLLGITSEEYRQLAYAYQADKADSKYREVCKAFNFLYSFDPETETEIPSVSSSSSPVNGQALKGRGVVFGAVKQIIGEKSDVQILWYPSESRLCDLLAAQIKKSLASAEWLVPLEKVRGSSDANIECFLNIMPVIFSGNVRARRTYIDIDEWRSLLCYPYYIMNERELLLISPGADSAVYFDDPEICTEYHRRFSECYAASPVFMEVCRELTDFLECYDSVFDFSHVSQNTELFIIEKNPCILFDVKTNDIVDHIQDFEGAQELAFKYMEFLAIGASNMETVYSFFSHEGLEELINADVYYEITPQLSKPISTDFRRNALKRLVEYSSAENRFLPLVIRLPIFDKTKVRALNLWSDGKMLVCYDNETSIDILMVNENSIMSVFVDYYRALMKCGLIKNKELSLDEIREALDNAI